MSWNTGQSKSADGLIDNTPNLMLYCNFSVDKLGSSNWLLKIFVDCLECNVKIMVSGWSWLDCTMYFSLSILIFYLSEWSVVSVPYQFLSFILAYGTIFFFDLKPLGILALIIEKQICSVLLQTTFFTSRHWVKINRVKLKKLKTS